jgi:hypothetical protein
LWGIFAPSLANSFADFNPVKFSAAEKTKIKGVCEMKKSGHRIICGDFNSVRKLMARAPAL